MTTTAATAPTATTRTPADERSDARRRSALGSVLGIIGATWRRIGELGDLGPGPEQSISRHLGGRV